jgi:ATP-dependent DNA helicase RecQ
VLKEVYGYDAFRPAQEHAIERVVAGEHVVLVMPTGGGKSLCYQIPALVRPGVGIVVSPLIALMQDQVESLKQLGVRAEFLNSTVSGEDQHATRRAVESGELDLLYVAPERLMKPTFLDWITRQEIALLAIDEAHCISQWGHDFRPEYRQLAHVRDRIPGVPCIAVTATADRPTQEEILTQLDLPDEALDVTGFDRPNIRYSVEVQSKGRVQLMRFLDRHPGEAGIVYCLSRKKVEQTAAYLAEQGLDALPYHAGLPAQTREANQQRFLLEEGVVMVATVAFGMGIDKPNVRFVAHMDIPRSPEAYYQETGRAGRDGLPSEAWLLYSLQSVVMARRLMESGGKEGQHKWVERHKMDAMVGFCETAACRRSVLLKYFGQPADDRCGNCDTCLHPVETWDATEAAQKVMSAVHRTGQRWGQSHIISVLLGEETEKVVRSGHQRLPTFGVGQNRSANEWRSVIRQLVAQDLLRVDVTGYGGLRLAPACGPVLKGEQDVHLRVDPDPPKARSRKGRATQPVLETTPAGQNRFEDLRALRLELAREQGVPPYVIFSDRTLTEMAERVPVTLDDLLAIAGVGAVKLERYGQAFLDRLAQSET